MSSATPTAAQSAVPLISSLYDICVRSFRQLYECLEDSGGEFDDQTPPPTYDELGRFRVWAGNVGAHRVGRMSLDHKLRESFQIHSKVSELLMDLDGSLKAAIAIVSHQRIPYDELVASDSSDSSVDDDDDESLPSFGDEMIATTELQEQFKDISHVITCLYRFTIAIRSPAQRDRLQKCAFIDVSHYEFFDIQHASNKFPGVEQTLLDRLGKANSRRRQLLIYHEKHQRKIARYINAPARPTADRREETEYQDLSKIAETLPMRVSNPSPGTIATTINTYTTVSTFIQGPVRVIDTASDAGQSQTSYATSSGDDTRCKLRVPPPPNTDGEPFECPYCFTIVDIDGPEAWMKHVFRDLRPYVCTFPECPKPDRLFGTRQDWYDHEVEFHRREWFCNSCVEVFRTKTQLREHLGVAHPNIFTVAEPIAIDRVVDRCERAIDSVQACPLCVGKYTTQRLRGHLARHMQQLSLFALPRMAGLDEDGESVGAQASIPDEEQTDNSLEDSAGPDRLLEPEFNLLPEPDPEGVDDAFDIDEIPDIPDETLGDMQAFYTPVIEKEKEVAEPVIEEERKISEHSMLILLLGSSGSGKSHFARMATGDQTIIVSKDQTACTQHIQPSIPFKLSGRTVQLIDTPGLNGNNLSDEFGLIADWMKKSFKDSQRFCGMIYFQRITDVELDQGAEKCLDWLSDVCGPGFIEHTILLTTMWDKITNPEMALEFDEKDESGNIKQSGAMYGRNSNDKAGCNKIINQIIGKAPRM